MATGTGEKFKPPAEIAEFEVRAARRKAKKSLVKEEKGGGRSKQNGKSGRRRGETELRPDSCDGQSGPSSIAPSRAILYHDGEGKWIREQKFCCRLAVADFTPYITAGDETSMRVR